jgi:hypothetical protein
MIAMLFILVSCGRKTDSPSKAYDNSTEALADYAVYLERISAKKNVSTQSLITLVRDWKELDDTLAKHFFAEAYTDKSSEADSNYVHLREKIIEGFAHLVDTRPRSLEDYLDMMTALNKTTRDSLVTSLHRFYGSMDGTKTYGLSNAATVVRYEQMLSETLSKGLHTKPEVFTFLRAEDKAFRSFLEHLPTLGNIPLTQVRDNTSMLLKQLVELAAEEHDVFTPEEVVTIITMRNTRRLMQNALQCVNDITAGRVAKDDQAAAYMWMLLQPWVSFDSYAFTLMSQAQLKTMRILATHTQKCITQLGNPDFPISPADLPSMLMKTCITSL